MGNFDAMTPDEQYVYSERIAILLDSAYGEPTEEMKKMAREDVERFRRESDIPMPE